MQLPNVCFVHTRILYYYYTMRNSILLLILAFWLAAVPVFANTSKLYTPPEMKVTIVEDHVTIAWQSFEDASEFLVEVATTTTNKGDLVFETLGVLSATSTKRYTYKDVSSNMEGLRYYRVTQVTQNGSRIVSDVKTANFLTKGHFTSSVEPNSDFSAIGLDLNTTVDTDAMVSLVDINGNEIYSGMYSVKKGHNHLFLELDPEMATGAYILSIEANGGTQMIFMNKQPVMQFISTAD